jgi:hypothetical protein
MRRGISKISSGVQEFKVEGSKLKVEEKGKSFNTESTEGTTARPQRKPAP